MPSFDKDRGWLNVAMVSAGVAVATMLTRKAIGWWRDGRRLELTRQRKRDECRRQLNELSSRVNARRRRQHKVCQRQ